jgi:hypothetical protein
MPCSEFESLLPSHLRSLQLQVARLVAARPVFQAARIPARASSSSRLAEAYAPLPPLLRTSPGSHGAPCVRPDATRQVYSVHAHVPVSASFVVTSAGLLAESAGGIRWTAPTGWKADAPRPMRAATYSISLVAGDRGIAECVVNYFGPGEGAASRPTSNAGGGRYRGPMGSQHYQRSRNALYAACPWS